MADDGHIAQLKKGVAAWNAWREQNPNNRPDLSGADLSKADLRDANLRGANLRDANLSGAHLIRANLDDADLSGAILVKADLSGAKLGGANLSKARLNEAVLNSTMLVNTDLAGADLTGCNVFGVSAWGLKLDEATKQQDLVITPEDAPEITVDDIEVAQFIYLLLNNEKIRDVIDTVTSKAVLILGRFTNERKAVLDALREELRKRDYLPILFDFEKPRSRDTDETITLLARMARFVIADISDAKAVLQELRAIVPELPSLPVQPIILATQEEPGMFDFYRNRPSFLTVHRYADQEQLLADLGDKVIRPAELKVRELRG
jgi:Pentapeptide repeats (8 copies)